VVGERMRWTSVTVHDFTHQHVADSGVVSGTTVRALVPGRFGRKIKKNLKDTTKEQIKIFQIIYGVGGLGRRCMFSGRFCSAWVGFFDLTVPVFLS